MSVLLAMQNIDKHEWQEKVLSIYSQVDTHGRGLETDFATDEEENGNEDDQVRVEASDDGERNPQHHESEIGDILASQAMFEEEPEDDINSTLNKPTAAATRRDQENENGHGDSEEAWWEVAESDSQLSANSFNEVGSARTFSSLSKRMPSHRHGQRERTQQQVRKHFVHSFPLSRCLLLSVVDETRVWNQETIGLSFDKVFFGKGDTLAERGARSGAQEQRRGRRFAARH